jgi:hypothetical protein
VKFEVAGQLSSSAPPNSSDNTNVPDHIPDTRRPT